MSMGSEIMIESWHLIWIVPVSVWVGFMSCAVIGAWTELLGLFLNIFKRWK